MIARWLAPGLLALATTQAAAQGPAEWIGQAPLPGLVIGFHQADGASLIVERIPRGEAIQRWTRMVSTQRFAGVIARGGTLDEWRGHFLAGLATGCPGFRGSTPARLQVAGRPAIEFRIDCPRNPATGLPETFLMRVIAGQADLHVAQVAFRSVPTAADIAWARTHLASVTLCTRAITAGVCRAGPEAVDHR